MFNAIVFAGAAVINIGLLGIVESPFVAACVALCVGANVAACIFYFTQ